MRSGLSGAPVRVFARAGLAATVGTFDPGVEVVGPPELRAAFAELSRRCAAAPAG